MKILIAKQNEQVVSQYDNKITFAKSTKNTSFFTISKVKFQLLVDWANKQGYNPYALFYW